MRYGTSVKRYYLLGLALATELMATATARADAPALDLDGDGRIDAAHIAGDAVVVQTGTQALSWRNPGVTNTTRLTPVAMTTGNVLEVRSADHVWVLLVQRGQLSLLTEAAVGAIDEDGELVQTVEVLPQGVVRAQVRTDITRCDGLPARLFATRWDLPKRSFVAANALGLPAAQATLTATEVPQLPTSAVFAAVSESYRSDASDARFLAVPTELGDRKAATLWPNGSVADARGAFVNVRARWPNSAATQLVVQVRHNEKRRSRLVLATARGNMAIVLPAATPGLHTWMVSLADPVDCISLFIDELSGPLAEIAIVSRAEATGNIDAELVTALIENRNLSNAQQILMARGHSAAVELQRRYPTTTGSGARQRLLAALRHVDATLASPLIVTALVQGELTGPDATDELAALAARKAEADLRSIAFATAASDEVRRAAIAHLAALGPSSAAALLPLLGQGTMLLRHATIQSAARAPVADLMRAANAPNASSGDTWQALRLAVEHAPPAEQVAAVALALQHFANATTWEVQARLVGLAAALGDEAALQQVVAQPSVQGSAALRLWLARHAATNTNAFATLLRLLDDVDPGVRAQASESIAAYLRSGGAAKASTGPWIAEGARDQVSTVLANRIGNDTWASVRRAAAHALAVNCGNAAVPALRSALEHDANVGVQLDVLDALVACDANASTAVLASTWSNAKRSTEVRERAVALGARQPTLIARLRQQLRTWRAATSDADAHALRLAQKATVELGRAGATMAAHRPAIRADLLDALGDSAYPEIVAAAITGLSELGELCGGNYTATLAKYVRSEDQAVALAAKQAIARCKPQSSGE